MPAKKQQKPKEAELKRVKQIPSAQDSEPLKKAIKLALYIEAIVIFVVIVFILTVLILRMSS